PFFVVSTTAPLVQRWFASSGHRDADDPYFLYAASNAGSMLALLAYPTVVEPVLRLGNQTRFWTWGYGAFAALTLTCGVRAAMQNPTSAGAQAIEPESAEQITWAQRLRWVVLALVPSS